MRRVVFLIRSLNRGGTERQLVELATRLDPALFEVVVLTFYTGGAIWDELAAVPGIRLESLGKRGRWDNVGFSARLVAWLRRIRPAILHCYLIEPSILGLVLGRLAGVPAIVWGVRASNVDYLHYDLVQWASFKVAARLSRWADAIIANSEAGRAYYMSQGYSGKRCVVVSNGIDTERFRPSVAARAQARARWEAGVDDVVIGIAARLDPMKGHLTLLAAARSVMRECPNARFVILGSGPAAYAAKLRKAADDYGIAARIVWTNEQPVMAAMYPGFDLACSSSSFGEGFSNAVGEAMACAVPCVVTDVGDSAFIVGDNGYVVPPDDPRALANAIVRMAQMDARSREEMGHEARSRIVQQFGLNKMVQRTQQIYSALPT